MRRLRLFLEGYRIARPIIGRRRARILAWRLASQTPVGNLSGDAYLGDAY